MRFVEFIGFVVVALAVSVLLLGRPHTLESTDRRRDADDDVDDA